MSAKMTPPYIRWQNAAHRLNAEAYAKQSPKYSPRKGSSTFVPCEKARVYIDACQEKGAHPGTVTVTAQATLCSCHGAVDMLDYEYDPRFRLLHTTGRVEIVFVRPFVSDRLSFVEGEVVHVSAWSVKESILKDVDLDYAGTKIPPIYWRMKMPEEVTHRVGLGAPVTIAESGKKFLVQYLRDGKWVDDAAYATVELAMQRANRVCQENFPAIFSARVVAPKHKRQDDAPEYGSVMLQDMTHEQHLAHKKLYHEIGSQVRDADAFPGVITLEDGIWPTPEQIQDYRDSFLAGVLFKNRKSKKRRSESTDIAIDDEEDDDLADDEEDEDETEFELELSVG